MEKEDAIVKKFSEDGVVFKGKLIGIDPVTGPRGDKMCHSAMQRLKAVAKNKGSHKERITISISFDGIKVVNEKTSDVVSHQRIPMISYISRDTSDTRSFGYVCGSPDTGHQFVAIKTEKSAIPVMKTIGELFKYVYEKKKREMNSTGASSDNGAENSLAESGNSLSVPSLNASQDLSNNGLTKSPSPTLLSSTERYAKWEDFNDTGNTSDLDKSGSKIRTRKTSSASSASGGGFPLLPAPTSPKRKHGRKLLTSGGSGSGSGSGSGGEKKSEEAKFSDLFDSDFSDIVLTPPVPTVNSLPEQSQPFSSKNVSSALFDTNTLFSTPTSDTFKPVEPTPALSELKQLSETDRYAAFNEIHSIPSVFDAVLKTNIEATKSNENLFSTDFNNGYKSDPSKPGHSFNNTHYKVDGGTMSPSSNLFSSGFDVNSATMSPPSRKAFANTPFSTPFDEGWTTQPTGAFQEIPKPSQPFNTFGDDADFFRSIAASNDTTHKNQNGFEKSKSNGRLEASNNSLDMLFSDSFLFESFNSTKSFTEFKNVGPTFPAPPLPPASAPAFMSQFASSLPPSVAPPPPPSAIATFEQFVDNRPPSVASSVSSRTNPFIDSETFSDSSTDVPNTLTDGNISDEDDVFNTDDSEITLTCDVPPSASPPPPTVPPPPPIPVDPPPSSRGMSPFNPFAQQSNWASEPPPRPPPRELSQSTLILSNTESKPTPSPPIPPRPSSSASNYSNSPPPPPLPKRRPLTTASPTLANPFENSFNPSNNAFGTNTATSNQSLSSLRNKWTSLDEDPFVPTLPNPLRKTKQRSETMFSSVTLPRLRPPTTSPLSTSPRQSHKSDTSRNDDNLKFTKANAFRTTQSLDWPDPVPILKKQESIPISSVYSNFNEIREEGKALDSSTFRASLRFENLQLNELKREIQTPPLSSGLSKKSSVTSDVTTTVSSSTINGAPSLSSSQPAERKVEEEEISPPERNIFLKASKEVDPFADDEFFKC